MISDFILFYPSFRQTEKKKTKQMAEEPEIFRMGNSMSSSDAQRQSNQKMRNEYKKKLQENKSRSAWRVPLKR